MTETHHPLQVSAETEDIKPCVFSTRCKLWGSGVLRLTPQKDKYNSTTVLTGFGCESQVCPNPPLMTRDDLKIIYSRDKRYWEGDEIPVPVEIEAATDKLAEVVQKLPKASS